MKKLLKRIKKAENGRPIPNVPMVNSAVGNKRTMNKPKYTPTVGLGNGTVRKAQDGKKLNK